MGRLYESLLRIRRADITALAGFLLFKHPECDSGSGCRYAAVNGRSHRDQGVKLVVALPHEASYIDTPQTYEAVSRCLLDHFS